MVFSSPIFAMLFLPLVLCGTLLIRKDLTNLFLLLASLLFGRPVQQQTAAKAYRKFKSDGWDTPEHFTADDQHPLWHELWEGDYHRMSSVMSEELRDVMRGLTADYEGSVARLVRTAGSRAEVTARLEQFKGVGPKTTEIFLREVPDTVIGSG